MKPTVRPALAGIFVFLAAMFLMAAKQPQTKARTPDFDKLTAYPVSRVVDGDTIIVSMDGKQERVRLVGVDTPETVDPRKPVQRFGKEASDFTKKHLGGEKMFLVYDQNGAKTAHRDRYGRILAYVWREKDKLDFCAELVKQGYAYAYLKYPSERGEEFLAYQKEAREQKRGLWGDEQAAKEVKADKEKALPGTVYVTNSGTKYHAEGCRFLAKSSRAIPLADARGKFEPCKVCRPPE